MVRIFYALTGLHKLARDACALRVVAQGRRAKRLGTHFSGTTWRLMAKSKGDILLMTSKGIEIGGRVYSSRTMKGQNR
jgi:hypothetical protein